MRSGFRKDGVCKRVLIFAKRVVQYTEGCALKPCLKTEGACTQQAETAGGQSFSCSSASYVQVVENTGITIVTCRGGENVLFNMETCEWKAEWDAHEDHVNCVAVTTDERLVVSGSCDRTGTVWDMKNNCDLVAVYLPVRTSLVAPSYHLIQTRACSHLW